MQGIRVGYKRISTPEQSLENQLKGIELDRVYADVGSGKNTDRTQFEEMMRFVREGDIVIISSMDRLARNVDDLRKIVQTLTNKKVCVQFIRENITFSGNDSAMAMLLLSLMGAFAEFERAIMLERQRDGMARARAKGLLKGRKPLLTNEKKQLVKKRIELGLSVSKVSREFKVSRGTIYNALKSD